MKKCERCFKENAALTGSMFNTQMICLECEEEERKHPKYEEARKKENEEVKKGNYNYPGIGLPNDLK
jgi:hypothetical protein